MSDEIKKLLTPLTDEQIEAYSLSISDLWMIKTNEKQIHGPFSTQMLKNAFKQHKELIDQIFVYNLLNEKWIVPHEDARLQRRKLDIISDKEENYFQFYTLKNGQKQGPFSVEKIKQKLESKELLYHDQISHDGSSWKKVYLYSAFDRRNNKNTDSLPFSPKEDKLSDLSKSSINVLSKIKQKNEEINALAGLAFIGHGNDKGQLLEDNSQEGKISNDLTDEVSQIPSRIENLLVSLKDFVLEHKKATSSVVAAMLLVFIGSFSSNSPNRDIASEFKESQRRPAVENEEKKTQAIKAPPAKRLSAKKIQPIKRKRTTINRPKKISRPRVAPTRREPRALERDNQRDPYLDDYEREDYDMVDVEDPRVREELSREMAGNYSNDDNFDDPNLQREREFVDQIENGELSPEMERDLEEKLEHYEEVSDFD